MKQLLILFVFCIFSSRIWAQGPPPSAAMPKKENIVLIDVLFKASDYETYFRKYCYEKIDAVAAKRNWKPEVINERKAAVSFSQFRNFTVYNSFSFVTAEQLKSLIKIVNEINKDDKNRIFITDGIIQSNLESFVESRYLRDE